MNPYPEPDIRLSSQRLAHLRDEAAELERRLSELARLSLAREHGRAPGRPVPARAPFTRSLWTLDEPRGANVYRTPEHVPADYGDGDGDGDFGPGGFGHHGYGDGYRDPDYGDPDYRYPDYRDGEDGDGEDGDGGSDAGDCADGGTVSGDAADGSGGARDGAAQRGAPLPGPAAADRAYGNAGGEGAGADAALAGDLDGSEQRTEVLVNHGRTSAYCRGLSRGRKVAIALGAAAALALTLVLVLSTGSASWPASVPVMQKEAGRACQNPDVKSEPGQVNFACAQATRQVLWVFALLTSDGNPKFTDPRTGRVGLEPITRAQGGALAWSLNLHHPYDPADPIDSLQVAARAINNIIGGATVTGTSGKPVVQPGLEGDAANCLRYTGSAALTTRSGFPAVCARPVSSPAGQAALVADVYQKWMVGAPPAAAQDAAVLFANAKDPGNPQVQAILRRLERQHR